MKRRHLGKIFLLTIVTLGIYNIYWFVMTRREMLSQGAPHIPSVWILFAPLLALGGMILLSVIEQAVNSDGRNDLGFIILFGIVVAAIAMLIVTPVWIWHYGKAVEALTGGETTRQYVFWIWILLTVVSTSPVWLLIMQHEFNIVAKNNKKEAHIA